MPVSRKKCYPQGFRDDTLLTPKDTSSRNTPKLQIESLSVVRGKTLALDKIDLTMRSREFLCIVGPSGAGKSTLIESVLGTIPISCGTIRIDGQDVMDRRPQERNLGVLFQEHSLLSYL